MDRYSLETSRSKFYAGGDLITGASNVSNAMGYGKKAARNIDERLMGGEALGRHRPAVRLRQTNRPTQPEREPAPRARRACPPAERVPKASRR